MASRSPLKSSEQRDYLNGWAAMTRLMDSGASWSGRERNCAYVNLRDGTFADASAVTGLDFLDDGRALAVTDWDGDGDLDLWFKNRTGPQLRFMRNDDDSGRGFVAFKLVGNTCNRDAIGAVVEVYTPEGNRVRRLAAGEGYLAQSSKWLHFGLGGADRVDRVVVKWPGSAAQDLSDIRVDRRYVVRQGAPAAEQPARRVTIPDSPADLPPPAGSTRIVLRDPLPLPPSLTGSLFPAGADDRAKLINLWAHWCAPCIAELTEIATHYAKIREGGLDVVALSLDKASDLTEAERVFTERIMPAASHPDLSAGVATEAMRATLEAILRHVLGKPGEISLPTSLLVDRRGAVQIVYLGPVAVDQLLADAADYGLKPDAPRVRSSFPGRWYYGVHRDLKALARDLLGRDRKEDARFYALEDRSRRRQP